MREKGEGQRKETGKSVLEDKGLPLGREETDVAHWQMVVYKGKIGNLIRKRCLIINEHANWVRQRGLKGVLIAELQRFDN